MKNFKVLIVTFLIFSVQKAVCQTSETIQINENYFLSSTFQTNSTVNYFGDKIANDVKIHNRDLIIKVANIKGDSIIFQYWKFKVTKKNNIKAKENNISFVENLNENLIYFYLDKKDFKNLATKYYPIYKGAVAGFYSVPFKLRFNDFDFEQNLNLGLNIGFQYRFSKKIEDRWIVEPNIGFGISKINLNPNNSNVTENRSASAFSATAGIILRVTNTINLGAFLGKDFLGKNDLETNWKYDKKTWFGLGLNVGFSVSDRKKANDIKN